MSLLGALSSAISALNAQSQAIAMVSDNLANSSTYGYKTTYASFEELLSGSSSAGYSSGGVAVQARSNISEQGLLTTTTSATDIAIEGNGFFPVRYGTDGTSVYYTRNGAFEIDTDGYLVNNGYYLLGWRTDTSGNVIGGTTSGSLTAINTNILASSATATTEASIKANLPAEAEVNDSFTSTMQIYDSLGTASNVEITWTKTAENTWTASFGDPTLASNASTTTGTVSSSAITLSFNGDGTLASTSPDPASLTITGWTTGAADSSISLDLGTAGSADGLTQYSSGASTPAVTLDKIDQNGVAYGKLSNISIGDDGIVTASYDNGQTIPIYQIPVATFTNPNGLEGMSNGIYQQTAKSGASTLHIAGTDGAGSVHGGQLEASTTDTNEQFSTMIAAQQAYSSAAQVISAVDDMFDTLISAVR